MRRITTFVALLQVISYLGHPKTKVLLCTQAVYNNKYLAYWKLDLDVPKFFKRVLQTVLRLILSAYPGN